MEFWPLRPSTTDLRLSIEQTATLLSRTTESHDKLLAQCDGNRWLSVNFYRGREHGRFSAHEINVIETVAPLILQISRLHYRAYLEANEMPALLSERVASLYPELTRRDQGLLQLMLAGCEVEGISVSMGIHAFECSYVYQAAVSQVGGSGQRELLALATQRKGSGQVH